ncbi:MAG TPA: Rid family hydrolase [Anaerohalosphaeraceae bacterium]|nr:hypothetical protein [Phycisphaerae bacterium]HOK94713.1 Rid family hydrolase [Anaerohalosphaeraceae bacterium]HOL30569.1 Rid family hydrolase [Anaerohalosphaeraceae bacterium]HOM75053.1 Rid family hydrolase [Anaerohalosphaeraceae bacterium]HPC63610.1 Rid family hydrolase [Anaerohalosphaeraceae bacterium]
MKITDKLHSIRISGPSGAEYFLHAQNRFPAQAAELLAELSAFLQQTDAQLVYLRIFAQENVRTTLLSSCLSQLQRLCCPIIWIRQDNNNYAFGLQGYAVEGTDTAPIMVDNRLAGRCFTSGGCRYYHFSFTPQNPDAGRFEQAAALFAQMQKTLSSAGLDFSSAVRTWLFAEDILSWYSQLNQARTAFFTEHNIFQKLVPASTGVGIGNLLGGAIAAELLAVKPLNGCVRIEQKASPLQCEALAYKSSFSRAVLIASVSDRRLIVSGTASIDQNGLTVWPGDCAKQIEQTMQVVHALLDSSGMDWNDTVRAIAYFKNSADFGLFDAYCQSRNLCLPHLKVQADICRPELVFEIELDAVRCC